MAKRSLKKISDSTEKHGVDRKTIVLAAFGGLLLTVSFPKAGLEWLAWVALVPLFVSISRLSPGRVFRIGLVAGFAHYLTLLYWLAYTMQHYGHLPFYISVPALVLFSLYLGLFPAVFAWLLARFARGPIVCMAAIPVFWVSLEFVRSFLFSGFPWELLGHSQYPNISLIQISDIAGVYGISFLIALANGAVFMAYLCLKGDTWQGKPVSKQTAAVSILVFMAVFCAVWGYGKWRVGKIDSAIAEAPSMKVTVVQGNIDQLIKWKKEFQTATTQKYVDLSFAAQTAGSELVVWPESATPFHWGHNQPLTRMVKNGIKKVGTHFLIGSPTAEGKPKDWNFFNSAYLFGPTAQILGRYDKVHLVPFGEYVPLRGIFPFGKIVEHVGDFQSGEAGRTLEMGDVKLGAQVCYEIIFPELCRAMAKNGANLLVNITNDAWYGITSAPYQHFSITIFRAVENKRSLVRSANTGISGFVDPAGRVIAQTAIFQDAVLSRAVPVMPESEMTVYTKYGDWFAAVCVAASFVIIIGIEINRRKKSCLTN